MVPVEDLLAQPILQTSPTTDLNDLANNPADLARLRPKTQWPHDDSPPKRPSRFGELFVPSFLRSFVPSFLRSFVPSFLRPFVFTSANRLFGMHKTPELAGLAGRVGDWYKPAMPDVNLKALLEVALEAAHVGGRRTLAHFNANVDVEHKPDNTPVTVADRDAETVIRSIIHQYFPTHDILGEEHGRSGGDPDYTWIVDPIDGTKSFIHGVPLYGTVVGCLVKNQPLVGAVSLPPLGELYGAAAGLGATLNGRACRVSSVDRLEDATLLAGSIVRAIKRSDAFENLEHHVKLTRGWGDVFGYMLVASGRAEIMLDPTISLWDIAGVAPIIREAGGSFTNWAGQDTVNGPDACATNAHLKQTVLNVLAHEKRKT